ncbi:MAG: DM13 domain-containing protein [Patescibacteria group bacterium]
MKLKTVVIIVLTLIVVVAELFYFRFHTYFQTQRVSESLPVPSNSMSDSLNTIVRGQFVEVDPIHKGSGTAQIIEQEGKRYLRFENFEVTNGPDLFVYLSESKTPGNDLKSLDKYINLGRLKGNVGNQNYEIPEPFRGYDTVIIWCQKFGVLFSYAVMQ